MAGLGAPPWTNAAVTVVPLFEPYLQFADAVLVHSKVALLAINDRLPSLQGYVLPQSYPIANTISELGRRSTDALRLGVFGWIEPHKRIDQVLAAVAEMKSRGVALELEVCGPTGATMRGLNAQIAAMGLEGSAHLRGHLDHQALLAAIAATDVCINLRDPTMGETSAIVVQALQLGTPVIVSDTGWYSELPECVLKVPTGSGAIGALVAHLSRLDADRNQLAAIAAATRRYAAAELDFGNVVARYREIIMEVAHLRDHRRAIEHELYANVARAMADLGLASSGHEAAITADIFRALGPCL
jgi:glycosyltransferase involved in cell wall biosynthesis